MKKMILFLTAILFAATMLVVPAGAATTAPADTKVQATDQKAKPKKAKKTKKTKKSKKSKKAKKGTKSKTPAKKAPPKTA